METVVDEKPLALATSRIVALVPFPFDRFTGLIPGVQAHYILLAHPSAAWLEVARLLADTTGEWNGCQGSALFFS
jgi:hypothetical protein